MYYVIIFNDSTSLSIQKFQIYETIIAEINDHLLILIIKHDSVITTVMQ